MPAGASFREMQELKGKFRKEHRYSGHEDEVAAHCK